MREQVAAQVGDDPLADRHDQVIARPRSEREHRDDAEHRGKVGVDEPRVGAGEAIIDHPSHREGHGERCARGDEEGGERAEDAAPMFERIRQQRL